MAAPASDLYLRHYSGHVGSYGHEFIEFEISQGRLRFALNSNYRNEGLIRREMFLSPATIAEFRRIVEESEIVKEDDEKWPKKNVVGKQELEVKVGNYHISFEVRRHSLLLIFLRSFAVEVISMKLNVEKCGTLIPFFHFTDRQDRFPGRRTKLGRPRGSPGILLPHSGLEGAFPPSSLFSAPALAPL